MVVHLNKIPKKVLLYFIKKNPNFQFIKNKNQEELVNLILENDILCHWDYESYNLCPLTFLKKLCQEKDLSNKKVLKNKETMIQFLLEEKYDDVFLKIKHCLEKQEDLILQDEEIQKYL